MMICNGSLVKTNFLVGTVVETIDGKRKSGWRPTNYYVVKVVRPLQARGLKHIIRHDEINEVSRYITRSEVPVLR